MKQKVYLIFLLNIIWNLSLNSMDLKATKFEIKKKTTCLEKTTSFCAYATILTGGIIVPAYIDFTLIYMFLHPYEVPNWCKNYETVQRLAKDPVELYLTLPALLTLPTALLWSTSKSLYVQWKGEYKK